MITSLFPAISYVLISSFTPGPSNISTASLAVLHSYKKTLRFQAGLASGVFFFMLLSGWLSRTLGFTHGLMLQILNPKLVVYAFTLFSGFLSSITSSFFILIIVCAMLALVSFCATSTWALFGAGIRTFLRSPRLTAIVNVALSLLLVYAALTLADIL